MRYKYEHLTERIPYFEVQQKRKKMNENDIGHHIGQLKLLFSEILFISKFIEMKPTKVLYVGAGSDGYHNSYLADMFPEIQFDLWDPGKFVVSPKPNIKIFNKFFRNDSADKYANDVKNGEKLLFMSDIRNLEIANNRENLDKIDRIVIADMNDQMNWSRIIRPIASYLKFRLPYKIEKFRYFRGPVYLQPFSPLSTEARIVVTNFDDMKMYDSIEFDEKMAYFNHVIRSKKIKYKKWRNIMEKYNIINNWDSAYCFHILYYYLTKTNKNNSEESVAKLFLDIVDFYRKYNSKKADKLFYK